MLTGRRGVTVGKVSFENLILLPDPCFATPDLKSGARSLKPYTKLLLLLEILALEPNSVVLET